MINCDKEMIIHISGDICSKTNSVKNGPNLQSYLFQEFIALNPRRVEQNYTKYLLKMAKPMY